MPDLIGKPGSTVSPTGEQHQQQLVFSQYDVIREDRWVGEFVDQQLHKNIRIKVEFSSCGCKRIRLLFDR